MVKNTLLFCLTLSFALLAGCSGHPGAGKWVAVDGESTLFARVNVDFDGKAAIYPTDTKKPTRNCYWQASSAENIDIQCGTSDKDEGSLFYKLEVTTDRAFAALKIDDKIVGQFKRLP